MWISATGVRASHVLCGGGVLWLLIILVGLEAGSFGQLVID